MNCSERFGYIKVGPKEDLSSIAVILFRNQYSVSMYKRKIEGRAYETFVKYWKYGEEPKIDDVENIGASGQILLAVEKDRLDMATFLVKNGYTVCVVKKKRGNGRPYEYLVYYSTISLEKMEENM